MAKSDEIEKVRRQEGRRSRRPVDEEARERANRTRRDLRELLRVGDEWEFERYLVEIIGLRRGSEEYEAALDVWRKLHEAPGQRG